MSVSVSVSINVSISVDKPRGVIAIRARVQVVVSTLSPNVNSLVQVVGSFVCEFPTEGPSS